MGNKKTKYLNKYYVYYHIDPTNGQIVYAGKGTGIRAWSMGGRSKPHKAWAKALFDNGTRHVVKIAHVFKSNEDALIREGILIKYLVRTGTPLFNKDKKGGNGGRLVGPNHPCWGRKASKEARLKMSVVRKGVPRPDIADYARARMMGNTVRRGQKMSDDAKAKISGSLKGNQHRNRAIVCLNTGKIYSSVKEAWTELKLDDRSVYRMLKGERKHVKGYKFQYVGTED